MNQFSDRGPWRVVGSLPVYASTALVGLYSLTMLFGVVASIFGSEWQVATQFSVSSALWKGWVWQYLSYPLCNRPSIWFVLEMFLLFRFGREIEEFLGRRVFLKLYLLQVVAPPLCLTGVHLLGVLLGSVIGKSPGASGAGGFLESLGELGLSGSAGLHFAVFFAYSAVFPGVSVLFGLKAVWVAVILLGVYTLERLTLLGAGGGAAVWGELLVLWVGSVGGALYATWEKGIWDFGALPFRRRASWTGIGPWRQVVGRVSGMFRKRPRFEVVRDPVDEFPDVEGMECEELLAAIDPLLEKISRSGLSSLTSKERARLEAARAELMKKETARR